ncbi:MAG: rod-binding protein [Treponema sp.]|nr:rod-binding protein [Treponema sp.]
MNVALISNTYSGITNGTSALNSARSNAENVKFSDLLESLKRKEEASLSNNSTIASNEITEAGRLNGEFTSSFNGIYTSVTDKAARPQGAAANQAGKIVNQKTIDKTSKLYEKSMELETFFVKQMLSSMRKTVVKSNESGFAQNMYEDMLYDEYATNMTKNAGFGLADQIYLSLV